MSLIYGLLLLQLTIICCLVIAAQAEKVLRPNFKDIQFWSDEQILKQKITYDAKSPHLDFTYDLLEQVNDVDINYELRIVNKKDAYYTSTFNATLNLCRLLKWTEKSAIGQLVHGYLKTYGHIISTCPVVKGQYAMHNFWWPEDTAAIYLPEVDFVLKFQAYNVDASKNRKLLINNVLSGEFTVQDVTNPKPGLFAMLPKVG